ncbi:MAG: mechanosensitive ion channel domain-containing protein [Nitriliruptor sp.]
MGEELQVPDEVVVPTPVEVRNAGDLWDVLREAVTQLGAGFVAWLPLLLLAILVLVLALIATRYAIRGVERGLRRARVDDTVQRLVTTLLRVALVIGSTLLALSIAGISVGAALAGLGLAGLALAFALQNILENFVAGLLILIRRPFHRGDQIISGDFEGTVEDVDLRVTRIVDYDGELVLVPNATVFTEPLINLTRRGRRRTRVTLGIDYRDDHDAAGRILREATAAVEGVLASPAPEALVTALGESSVDFEIRYWTDPDIRTVRHTQDRVLRACKTAIEGAGMTIPWPIRTLAPDKDALSVRRPERETLGE